MRTRNTGGRIKVREIKETSITTKPQQTPPKLLTHFTVPDNIVTQNEENTKSVNVNRVLLDQISENSNDLFLTLPLINDSFLDVNMKKFSVLSPEHNLIIETSNGQETVEYIPDFQSYYILFKGNSIGTFLCFENSIIISYKYNNRQFEINKIDNEGLKDICDGLEKNTCLRIFEMEANEVTENVGDFIF